MFNTYSIICYCHDHRDTGGNRTMVAAATIVSMAAADGERISIFPLVCPNKARCVPLEFFWGEVAMMSPHDGGTHLEWGVEGRGMRAHSQILSDVSLSYSLKHISTGEHSLHISCRITHLLHLYFLFSWSCHQMETCSASLAFVRGIHRWLRGIHRSPVNSPHTDSDAELWCFLWSTPEQTVE